MLATLSPHGPRARVLALRSVDPAERLFVFHTDARSDKVRELPVYPISYTPALVGSRALCSDRRHRSGLAPGCLRAP
jgi:hypothetical protein